MQFKGAYIRKTTALYILQENSQLSNDRLLRVRSSQPSHLFSTTDSSLSQTSSIIHIGDLCLFRQIDNERVLLGRVVQFSYLTGTKKEREFSGSYVDMSNESYKGIGVYANWFARRGSEVGEIIYFDALDLVFKAGYHGMEHFVATVNDSYLVCEPSATLAAFNKLLPNWEELISDVHEFT